MKRKRPQQTEPEAYVAPDWASWIQSWCGTWHLTSDQAKKIEIGMLVVKFDDSMLHPGFIRPSAGEMTAGGCVFQAQDGNGKKQLKVIMCEESSAYAGGEVPTESDVYEEDDTPP